MFIDEGSKGFLFEKNVIYNTHGEPIRQYSDNRFKRGGCHAQRFGPIGVCGGSRGDLHLVGGFSDGGGGTPPPLPSIHKGMHPCPRMTTDRDAISLPQVWLVHRQGSWPTLCP